MIKILDTAEKISKNLDILKKDSKIKDFRIKVRLNANLDVFILAENEFNIQEMQEEYKEFKVSFKPVTEDDLREYSYLKEIFDIEEIIDLGLKYRFDSLMNKKEINKKHKIPIVTFYSYKGGMGRTTALVSYAMDLALNQNKRVCVIDCGFEAPGYMNFFDNEEFLLEDKSGIVEYLLDSHFQKEIDINNYFLKIKDIENIFVVPAGNLSENTRGSSTHRKDYLEALSRINISNESILLQGFESFFEKLIENSKPDIILIDSRTGFNDIFGVSALRLSDLIVAFFGSNEQTKPGLHFVLDKYYEFTKEEKNVELFLVNSILPENKDARNNEFHDIFISDVQEYLQRIQDDGKDNPPFPVILKLSRNSLLENLGINNSFLEHKDIIEKKLVDDYDAIFRGLNGARAIKKIFDYKEENKSNDAGLKNIILKSLKEHIRNKDGHPQLFAEDLKINPKTFFYRDSMKDIFKKEKFIIQGFKGTGKTYIYKALRESNKDIKDKLLSFASIKETGETYEFIDIISLKGSDEIKTFEFNTLKIEEIKNKQYYFTNFWKIYTWNSIFIDTEKKLDYKIKPELEIKPMRGDTETKQRFEKIMNDDNLMIKVEKDLQKLDSYLDENKKNLFVLYDQLDNLIPPSNWKEVVSPLIDYWWNSIARFKRISPKIFIRTDLYNRLQGTNTTRLENNKIIIEWSKDEIYAYFFKLIFSDQASFNALFDFMGRKRSELRTFIINTKKYLVEHFNQLQLDRNMIEPFMSIFFGESVTSYKRNYDLGKTYDWFYTNLRNADKASISLRPFINLVNGALDDALKNNMPNILCILDQKFYATQANRNYAVEQHFKDLTREAFNEDLHYIFDYIRDKGEKYRQIFLYKSELDELLKEIYEEYKDKLESSNTEELKEILIANGIISENVKSGLKSIFYFPQLYKYWLALKSRDYNDRERICKK